MGRIDTNHPEADGRLDCVEVRGPQLVHQRGGHGAAPDVLPELVALAQNIGVKVGAHGVAAVDQIVKMTRVVARARGHQYSSAARVLTV
jgi:hypothetical protein